MRVKMLALSIGPDHHWEAGKIYDMDAVTGDALASLGYAEILIPEEASGDAVQKTADGKRTRKPRACKAKSADS